MESSKKTTVRDIAQIDTHVSKAVSFVERAQKNGLTVIAVHETDDISENIHHLLEYTLKEHPDLSGIYAATGSILPSHFDNNELYSDGNDYRTDIP